MCCLARSEESVHLLESIIHVPFKEHEKAEKERENERKRVRKKEKKGFHQI